MPLYKALFTIAHLRSLLVVFLLGFSGMGCRKVLLSEESVHRTELYLAGKFGYVNDPELTALLDRVSSRIIHGSGHHPGPITLLVLDTDERGAFSTAGGRTYLTRGLILALRNEAELASIIAHELSHHLTGDTEREVDSPQEELDRELRADREGVRMLGNARYSEGAAFTALQAFSEQEPRIIARMRGLAPTLLQQDSLSTESSREFTRVKRRLRALSGM